jgi:hypothetical protein
MQHAVEEAAPRLNGDKGASQRGRRGGGARGGSKKVVGKTDMGMGMVVGKIGCCHGGSNRERCEEHRFFNLRDRSVRFFSCGVGSDSTHTQPEESPNDARPCCRPDRQRVGHI